MSSKRLLFHFVCAALALMLLPSASPAYDVEVFAEGAYTSTTLDVNIYANILAGNLCSYGVTLNYDTARLTAGTATKNQSIWYLGTSSSPQPYMDPDTATAGRVIFIGGKMDTGNPTAGVTGNRVLMGQVSFTRKDSSMGLGTTAQDYFGISLAIGKADPFDNFVTTAGAVKDQLVSFTANKVRERGDANGDGIINSTDYVAIRNLLSSPNPPPYADCNGDGLVNSTDYTCVRNKL